MMLDVSNTDIIFVSVTVARYLALVETISDISLFTDKFQCNSTISGVINRSINRSIIGNI